MPTLKTVAVFALLGWFGDQNPDLYRFGVNGIGVVCIPGADVDKNAISYAQASLYLKPAKGDYPGVPFYFSPSAISKFIPSFRISASGGAAYGPDSIYGSVKLLDKSLHLDLGKRARHVQDIWYSHPPCAHSIVVPLVKSSGYISRCDSHAWDEILLSARPGTKLPQNAIYDAVLAICWRSATLTSNAEGTSLETCDREFVVGNVLVEYSFSANHASDVRNFDEMLRAKVAEWRRNCAT